MSVKKKIFFIVALFYIVYIIFPLFADVINIPVWLPSIAMCAIIIPLYSQAYSNETFKWFLVYAAVLFLNMLVGRPLSIGIGSIADSKKFLVEMAYILPSISIFSVFAWMRDNELLSKLMKWTVVILFASFVVAVPLMLSYNSIREAMVEAENQESLRVPGLPSYGLMHAYTLFLPVFCFLAKFCEGKKKLLYFGGLAVLCFVIYDTFVTTSLVLMIAILIFTVLYFPKNQQQSLLVMFVAAVIFFVLYEVGFFVTLIDLIMPFFEDTAVEPKLIDIKNSMMQGHVTGESITARQEHHDVSIESFLSNPIFGSSQSEGHSTLLDRFGGMGIVVGVPYIMIIISFVKKMSLMYNTKKAKAFFKVGVLVSFVYLYNKGNWGCESWLFLMVLLPFGLLAVEQNMMTQSHNINK